MQCNVTPPIDAEFDNGKIDHAEQRQNGPGPEASLWMSNALTRAMCPKIQKEQDGDRCQNGRPIPTMPPTSASPTDYLK